MKSTRLVTKAIIQFTLSLCTAMVLTSAIAQSASAKEGLWNVLKEGGKVVLMRHAPVERTPASGNPLLRDPSCINESNLSNQGIHQCCQRTLLLPFLKVLEPTNSFYY